MRFSDQHSNASLYQTKPSPWPIALAATMAASAIVVTITIILPTA